MAQHKSAEKRARSSKRKAVRNKQALSSMKTAIKRVRSATDKDKAQAELKKTTKMLDQLAAKRVIHPNKASNNKSRLTKFVSKIK